MELGLRVLVSHLMWVLGTESVSSERARAAEPLSHFSSPRKLISKCDTQEGFAATSPALIQTSSPQRHALSVLTGKEIRIGQERPWEPAGGRGSSTSGIVHKPCRNVTQAVPFTEVQTHWSKIGVKSVGGKKEGKEDGARKQTPKTPAAAKQKPESYSISLMSDILLERGMGPCGPSLAVLLSWTTSVRCCQSKTVIFLYLSG